MQRFPIYLVWQSPFKHIYPIGHWLYKHFMTLAVQMWFLHKKPAGQIVFWLQDWIEESLLF